jgi:predicted transcriptional regulator
MIKIKELEGITGHFAKKFNPLVKELSDVLKNGEKDHFELNKIVNKLIGSLNQLNHEIKETAQYSEDSKD